jgi:signal peptidase I
MAKPLPPPRPQLRAGDVVVLRQSQEYVEGEIITVVGDGRYKVRWLTGSDYQNRVSHHGGGSQEELAEWLAIDRSAPRNPVLWLRIEGQHGPHEPS